MIKYHVMKEGYILTVFKNERLSWLPYIAIVILLHVIGFSFYGLLEKTIISYLVWGFLHTH